MRTKRIVVSGLVQGVGYRFFAVRVAQGLGVTGFVRNLPEGTVEILAQSESEDVLKTFIAKLEQGPSSAYVRGIIVENVEAEERLEDFKILY